MSCYIENFLSFALVRTLKVVLLMYSLLDPVVGELT